MFINHDIHLQPTHVHAHAHAHAHTHKHTDTLIEAMQEPLTENMSWCQNKSWRQKVHH